MKNTVKFNVIIIVSFMIGPDVRENNKAIATARKMNLSIGNDIARVSTKARKASKKEGLSNDVAIRTRFQAIVTADLAHSETSKIEQV